MTDFAPNEERDEVFQNALLIKENTICFDCQGKNPQWASVYLGILICFECSGRHRSYGTHISFVRSITLDKWKRNQLKTFELAGNKFAKEQFNRMGVPIVSGLFDYSSSLITKYKTDLANRVKDEMGSGYVAPKAVVAVKEEEEVVNNFSKVQLDEKEEKEKDELINPKKLDSFGVSSGQVTAKKGKGKIKKIVEDFDFDAFDDVGFSSNTNTASVTATASTSSNFNSKNDGGFDEDGFNDSSFKEVKKTTSKPANNERNKNLDTKKAISSDDYNNAENEFTKKANDKKLTQLKTNQAICSSDIFGEEEEEATFGQTLKDYALKFTLSAAEKAKEIKNKATNFIDRIQKKYND